MIDALSFYGSQIILYPPKYFGRVPIVLDRPNSFWSGSNYFGQVQIIKTSPEKSYLNLTKVFGPDQINLDLTKLICTHPKTIWTVQNNFGPMEGQGNRYYI